MKKVNRARLEQTLRSRLESDMEQCRISGAQLLVLQEGEQICRLQCGYQDYDTKQPLREDAIFRLASMTKPVTGVAALIAMERGWFDLQDKVSDYLPDFAAMTVGRFENGAVVPDRPSGTPLRIWHLLSHCSGLMSEVPIGNWITAHTPKSAFASLADMVDYTAKQPLAFEPETYTAYTGRVSFDMVARIIELKSGMTYAEFLRKNIFEPLGLHDLTYHPTEEQWSRFIVPTDRASGFDCVTVRLGRHTFEALPLSYTSAGAGLVSTMQDYAVFAELLQNRGTFRGVRIFSPELLDEMTLPRVPDSTPGRDPISSWGLGVRVVVHEDVLPVGSFGWSGAYGTHFWVDPVNRITAIYMRCSRWYDSHGCGQIGLQFERDVMSSL